jgi:hypothetical protein
MFIPIKEGNDLPDYGETVLVKVPKMCDEGDMIMVATFRDEWYVYFPHDQPVEPTGWCYSIPLVDIIAEQPE